MHWHTYFCWPVDGPELGFSVPTVSKFSCFFMYSTLAARYARLLKMTGSGSQRWHLSGQRLTEQELVEGINLESLLGTVCNILAL